MGGSTFFSFCLMTVERNDFFSANNDKHTHTYINSFIYSNLKLDKRDTEYKVLRVVDRRQIKVSALILFFFSYLNLIKNFPVHKFFFCKLSNVFTARKSS